MIFNKDVVFPYPVLSNAHDDYPNSNFEISVSFIEVPNEDRYEFVVEYTLDSAFLNNLIKLKRAQLYCIIQSKDSKLFKFNGQRISVKKNKISLQTRTNIQLILVATEQIRFKDNHDLHEDYHDTKNKILILPNQTLALSSIERFDGELHRPYDLFTYSLDSNQTTDIKIELKSEVINIAIKDKKYLYLSRPNVNYHYVYIGLQRALTQFYLDTIKDEGQSIGETLDLTDMDYPTNNLYTKIYNLLKSKKIDRLELEKLDEAIYFMTDQLVEKHYKAINRGYN
jgi:hypothetical protein